MEVHIEFMDGSMLFKQSVTMWQTNTDLLEICQNWGETDHWEYFPLVNIKQWRSEY